MTTSGTTLRKSADQHRTPLATRVFRLAVIGASILIAASQPQTLRVSNLSAFSLFLIALVVARFVPVVAARERDITFCAAVLFAGSLVAGGPAAGLAAVVVYAIHGRLWQKGGHGYAVFLGAQYALASVASQAVFSALAGRPSVLSSSEPVSLLALVAAASAFLFVNGLLVAVGNLGTRYARRSYTEPLAHAYLLAYGVSFPYAVLLLASCGVYGAAALPFLSLLLVVCARSVKVTVENRSLKRAMVAVEELGRSSAGELREEAPLERFFDLAQGLVAFDTGFVWLAGEAGGALHPRASFPRNATVAQPVGERLQSLLNRAMRHPSDPLLVLHAPATEGTPVFAAPMPEEDESWILYPIVLHGQCHGVAQFVRRARRPFTRVDVDRLSALVPQAAVSFESARERYLMHQYREMMRRFQDEAQTDGLTGLYNHRRAQELLRDEVARAARYHHPLAVLMVDVDFFKQYNDAYGHPQGDDLLRSMAHILRSGVRTTDHVCRYGGEEFMLILPETTGSDAYLLAERLRSVIASAWFPAGEGWVVQKTVSIGLAAFPLDATAPAELLQQADSALYHAKRTGKNRVVMSGREVLAASVPEQART